MTVRIRPNGDVLSLDSQQTRDDEAVAAGHKDKADKSDKSDKTNKNDNNRGNSQRGD